MNVESINEWFGFGKYAADQTLKDWIYKYSQKPVFRSSELK